MEEPKGLTTNEALNILCKDVEQVLQQFELSQRNRKSKSWIRDALHHSSQHTTINWIAAGILLMFSVALVLSFVENDRNFFLLLQAAIIVLLTLINLGFELFDNKLRHSEILNRVKALLKKIKNESKNIRWVPENYPLLHSPFSPCITLQWTYRDRQLVNLPWALLVKDDIILMRPGQISPAYCEAIEKNTEFSLLHAKEVYGPSLQNANETFTAPKARKPLENKKYRLLETPYLNNLRFALEQALDRPVTQFNRQRHFIFNKIIERHLIPLCLAIIVTINLVKFTFLNENMLVERGSWIDMFLLSPMSLILPLLPMMFPIVWKVLNYLELARFKTLFDTTTEAQVAIHLCEEQDHACHPGLTYKWNEVLQNFVHILTGKEAIMARSANILHVLGSLTALCCADKKGILSWPNPTAEKVFFLHNLDNSSQSSSLANVENLNADADSLHGTSTSTYRYQCEGFGTAIAEVLDLTHDHNYPFKMHFDDTEWHKHLTSLKPLGLAILLNTCNMKTQECYTEFCSHITCEAMYNESLIPVTNRRCLCELAKEIGFVDQVQKVFTLEQELSTFRHLQPEMVRRDNKYARSLHLSTKLRCPFPHMFAVVVKELSNGSIQLLSEGTADIILDSCVDYWDGRDLCPLTSADRKKIQDFYQRSSLTAYCTAFAYRPLYKGIGDKLSNVYLELPSDSRHLYLVHRSPTPIHWECKSVLEPKIKTPLGHFYSTDSLLFNDSPASEISDAESCFEMQCNQIFVGMVTMQYQAISDMVHLIEQLEGACIRFVHFSKENELRSRVFSEKMGLESGWNCHISLLSERNRQESGPAECWANNGTIRVSSPTELPGRIFQKSRKVHTAAGSPTLDANSNLESSKALSFSAPSAINMEHAVVKFDTDHEPLMKSYNENDEAPTCNATSQDSVHSHIAELNSASHEWQSLSCLTDSTEQSAPINFDMSNRAKLPRGIDKIRPHIENIDNVPLLVSLFTDCTASTTREMLRIMQDYNEVVCLIGSSSNFENIGIFMQADASVAVEPLYPQVCQKKEVFVKVEKGNLSPVELSRALNSIACSLSVKREDHLPIYQLVFEARHYMMCLRNLIQFWICCCALITLIQLTALFFLLPLILTTGQILWMVLFVIPLLSVSLMGTPTEVTIMKNPIRKTYLEINVEIVTFIMWCYGVRLLPALIAPILSFSFTIKSYCVDYCSNYNCSCSAYYLPRHSTEEPVLTSWSEYYDPLYFTQNLIVAIIVINFIIISVGFVHREHSIWNRSPHTNLLWLSAALFLVIFQTFFTLYNYISDVGIKIGNPALIAGFASPVITFIVNEFIKYEEIKVNLRYQKRARLDFGTKLGMNSPF